jgi:uncharacterized MAPEG superfamily protein
LFGYLKPYRPELKIREAETYKAVYCGLCHELGKSFGPFARLTLSYDFAFLSLVGMSIRQEGEACFGKCRCIAHPVRKQACCLPGKVQTFSAAAAMVLFYYKIRDDLADRGFRKRLRAFLLLPYAKFVRKRALAVCGQASEVDAAAVRMTEAQQKLEAEGCSSVDRAAEPTAAFLSAVLGTFLSGDETQAVVLRRFGYLLGRYIYLCDALDDLEDDRKAGNYNPFLCAEDSADAAERAKGSLYLTVAEAGAAYDLLETGQFNGILENIVFLGLKNEVERILKKKGEGSNERSL